MHNCSFMLHLFQRNMEFATCKFPQQRFDHHQVRQLEIVFATIVFRCSRAAIYFCKLCIKSIKPVRQHIIAIQLIIPHFVGNNQNPHFCHNYLTNFNNRSVTLGKKRNIRNKTLSEKATFPEHFMCFQFDRNVASTIFF